MNVADIAAALHANAILVVFINVLLQQAGFPVPALPTLLIAGSLAGSRGNLAQMIAAATAATLIADALWYLAGRLYGYRVLAGLCKLSLNPESCIARAESILLRWGAWPLVVAKFVPGLSTVGPPIAGALKLSFLGSMSASILGAVLWAGGGILAGWLWRSRVLSLVEVLEAKGVLTVTLVVLCLVLLLAWALWRRHRARVPLVPPVEFVEAFDPARASLVSDSGSPVLKDAGDGSRPAE
jgi:membrane protein DedA with SNARE-associated domain